MSEYRIDPLGWRRPISRPMQPLKTEVNPARSAADERDMANYHDAQTEQVSGQITVGERRRSEREPCQIEAFLVNPDVPTDRQECQAVNLSKHGVALSMSRPMGLGDNAVLEIGVGTQRLIAQVRIVRCRRTGHNQWDVGADFW